MIRADLRLVAGEVDAIFRGLRDVRTINAEALRQDARSRLADGRYRDSLQELEVALAELLDAAQHASPLDFPIACDLFQSAKARQEPLRPAVVSAWRFMVETRGSILKPWLHSLLSSSDRSGFSSA
ncbi:hypothetical protein [Synechococcus sp. CBW1004]|uniref:hypothetical protein n=1 Tax=Synechococcus sp. CBW1004 TaxID=1353136 RepID=UPI0018CD229E|nr:hypothetical protein [Synechococcus sp. CBW1004]QPN63818.1 hypothetical protein H8F25_02825 [Synechococcus sp. CBW1004]